MGHGNGRIQLPGMPPAAMVQQVPSLRAAVDQPLHMAHLRAPWSRPVGLQTATLDGLLVRAVGGMTILEEGALLIGQNAEFSPQQAVERAPGNS